MTIELLLRNQFSKSVPLVPLGADEKVGNYLGAATGELPWRFWPLSGDIPWRSTVRILIRRESLLTNVEAYDLAGDNYRASHQNHAAWTKDDGCPRKRDIGY